MGQADFILESLIGCRDHGNQALFAGPFALPGDKPQYPRDRVVDIKHIRLDITLDLDAKSVAGAVTHNFSALNDGLDAMELDAVELDIGSVRSGSGAELQHSVDNGRLRIELGRQLTAGESESVRVEFSGHPRRGLYFIAPDEAYPNKRLEAWTQGEDEDTRHWFPCYDYPNEMSTSEMHVTVREPFIVIANGELRNVEAGSQPGTRTFNFHQDQPHTTYLTSVTGSLATTTRTRCRPAKCTSRCASRLSSLRTASCARSRPVHSPAREPSTSTRTNRTPPT